MEKTNYHVSFNIYTPKNATTNDNLCFNIDKATIRKRKTGCFQHDTIKITCISLRLE